ncbi:hypothetical protein [Flavobacteriaceae bacterium 14752]|uniref:hypothetical protein n=1 Tax=Mesohalobacter salilacus TaxID=2491711 RepID=UPI000F6309CB|nr:hypothetical protein EIG84_12160 [Flavobacteriaceae bacterium 14752]
MKKIFNLNQNFEVILILIVFNLPLLINAQSNFSEGFKKGYSEGYCHDSNLSCVPQSPPVSPVPNAYENSNSFKDGYNRGFQTALYSKKNNNSGGFKATEVTYIDGAMYNQINNIDINNIVELSKAIKKLKQKIFENLEDENYYGAIKLSELGLKVNAVDSEFHMLLGQANLALGNEEESIKWYKKSLKIKYRKPIADRVKRIENGYYSSKKNNVTQNSYENKESTGFQSYMTTFDNPVFEKKLLSKPDINAKVIYVCPKDSNILILRKIDENYFKARVHGHVGYILKSFIKLRE